MSTIGAWAGDNSSKGRIKRICYRNDESHKPCTAACRQQRQQETHSEQSIDYIKDVIDHLGDPSQTTRALDFALRLNYLVYRLRSEFARDLPDLLRFLRSSIFLSVSS